VADIDQELAQMTDEGLATLHGRLDESNPSVAAEAQAHHMVTTEILRRGGSHGHDGDNWGKAVILVESVEVESAEEIAAPDGMEKAWGEALADGGTVSVLLTVNGYVLKADPTVSEVHADSIMGKPRRRKAKRIMVDELTDYEKRAVPEVIADLDQNLENRQHAIDEYLYGPMNPEEPGDYWKRLGDMWDVSAAEAATTRCGNCSAFNVSLGIRSAMAEAIGEGGEQVVVSADLGYCELLDFKCAASRSCSAWLTGGPITSDSENDELGYEKSEEDFLASLGDDALAWYGDIGYLIDNDRDPELLLQKAGNPEPLREYWRGGGKGKIAWGAGGDFTSCVAAVSKYMNSEQAKGYCAIRHREVTGMWPGDKRNRAANKATDWEGILKHGSHNQLSHGGGGGGSAGSASAEKPWVGPGTGALNLKPEVKQRVRETLGNGQITDAYGESYARGKAAAKGQDIYGEPVRYSPKNTGKELAAEHKKRDAAAQQLMDAPRGSMLAENLAANVVSAQGFIDGNISARPSFRTSHSFGEMLGSYLSAGPSGALKSVDAVMETDDVAKHGTHDQSSHGRRGGGGSAAAPAVAGGGDQLSTWSKGMPIPAPVADHAPGTQKDKEGKLMPRTPEASAEAVALRARSVALEPKTTEMVTAMAAEHGGEMVGLEHRLKTTDSLARKIDADSVKEHGGDRAAAAASVSDSLRYTTVFDNDNYTGGVSATLKSLEADGYSIRAKNFWSDGDDYQGMNVKATKDGVTVELQFHTRDSVRVKETQLHPVYEEYRASTDNTKRRELWDKMVGIAATIPKPAGYAALLTIGTLTIKNFETAQQAGLLG